MGFSMSCTACGLTLVCQDKNVDRPKSSPERHTVKQLTYLSSLFKDNCNSWMKLNNSVPTKGTNALVLNNDLCHMLTQKKSIIFFLYLKFKGHRLSQDFSVLALLISGLHNSLLRGRGGECCPVHSRIASNDAGLYALEASSPQ